MTSSMLRRQLKNLVQNYSEAEVKVREATSNDPWGPSSSQMADISDLTYNVVACNEIMTMLWKRLKDDKNWRHIHKSLTLLEYLLKTGDDRVLLKMKDNIYIVKALTEYRFVEKDGKDQGVNVREKAKVVLVLMEDDEKLKEERDFAFKTREKTSKSSAASSVDFTKDPNYKPCYIPGATGLPSLDNIPSVADLTASFTARKEERLRQEAEKKEVERRANLSEDELKWEDAGKGGNVKDDAWGGQKSEEEEAQPDTLEVPREPKEALGPWCTPSSPHMTETPASSDPWGAPTKIEEDPFTEKTNEENPFTASKDQSNAFTSSKEDPFNASKDSTDTFSAPRGTQDPFIATHKPDPFRSANNDPFSAPKNNSFNTSKDDKFNTPKDDPFSAKASTPPKEHPFNSSKNYPFNTPKNDPFKAPTTPPKEDPFSTSKDDPFTAPTTPPKQDPFSTPKDDPFTAPTAPPKEGPFSTPKDDLFTAPTTPPKEDPFSTPKDDPFTAPATPPKEDPFSTPKDDPFSAPITPPKDAASDPFSAPPMSPPPGDTDAWGASVTSPPNAETDPWGATSSPQGNKDGDPWGDGKSASSPVDNSDPFGDISRPDNDPWGAQASTNADDAWGSPNLPPASSPSDDPFGDGVSKGTDPWGAPSSTSSISTDSQLSRSS